ncbi:TetR family transcriptional regulator [Anaerocolumna sedimenticola]|uniref:TetR family transcriptional regulator n=1 Tax=Anaerocolumna sedimenticola TaxID=2696063 RepID=A0A6P1TJH3_9FIRM|nr:TetR/AcrR family transcriptional regulator [Anaerocolumna sedimenticola]QHQ60191.1 TetR family transcriptional regulator [Anaerocolumna sedimenticola]
MKQSYHHTNLRNELIEVGIKMVQEVGVDKLSLRKLASLCGVSEAAPYKHFASKENLLTAMQEYVTQQLMNCLQKAAECTEQTNPTESILHMGKAYVLFFMNNPEYYAFLFLHSNLSINLSANENLESYPPFQYYRNQVFQVYRALGYSDGRIQYGLIAMWAKVHGIVAIIAMKNVVIDFEWEQVLNQILIE